MNDLWFTAVELRKNPYSCELSILLHWIGIIGSSGAYVFDVEKCWAKRLVYHREHWYDRFRLCHHNSCIPIIPCPGYMRLRETAMLSLEIIRHFQMPPVCFISLVLFSNMWSNGECVEPTIKQLRFQTLELYPHDLSYLFIPNIPLQLFTPQTPGYS